MALMLELAKRALQTKPNKCSCGIVALTHLPWCTYLNDVPGWEWCSGSGGGVVHAGASGVGSGGRWQEHVHKSRGVCCGGALGVIPGFDRWIV